ncbi:MAG TPA: DUF2330 domain-containing protein [Labilithrix sp.]|nr:DUF2330 domain-containing protein [Labilithrix sp.]
MTAPSTVTGRFSLLVLVVATVVLLDFHRVAQACGAFAGRDVHVPYLATEQVLLIWDKDTEIEDFVREARFEQASMAFGFVVPTPSLPEVFKVDDKPFDALRATYPYRPPPPRAVLGAGAGGRGAAGAEAPAGVVVVSDQRIGSFRAFVLSASDPKGLDQWLDTNGFQATEDTRPWITHYVALKFFFVALRYEPPSGSKDPGMKSETVRIRFKTPQPYYPFQEPIHKGASAPALKSRLLSVWLVTQDPMNAVAARDVKEAAPASGRGPWERPWGSGTTYTPVRTEVASRLGSLASLLPERTVVQAFQDRRVSRDGSGDVLFVSKAPRTFTEAEVAARRHLFPLLDSTLLEPDPGAAAGPAPAASLNVVSNPPEKCSTIPGRSAGGAAPIALFAVLLAFASAVARRSRASLVRGAAGLLVVWLVTACGKTSRQAPADASPSSSAPSVAREARAAREQKVLAILGGQRADEELPVAEQPPGVARGPSGNVTLGAVVFSGPAVADADRVMAGLRGRIRRCYEAGLDVDPNLKGHLEVALVVAADGEQISTSVAKNVGLTPAVAECARDVVRRATFSPPSGGGKAAGSVRFTFDPTSD